METTKKLNETPLIERMTDNQTYVIVDDQGNVSRIKDVAKEYVTETELTDFIKPYDERITTNQTDIVSTKTDVLDLETYIDIVTPKNTEKGELVHITDALPLPTFENKIDGNVEQETTTGKNLLPYPYKDTTKTTNGITFTDNKDGTITANGTATADAIFIIRASTDELASFIEGTNYILSGCFNDDSSVTYNNAPYYIANEWSGIKNYNTKGSQFTYNNISFIRDFKIVIKSGTTVSNLVFKPMIRLATITDDTYEPFTGGQASPNPEYPQEVEVIEGDLSYKVNGRNLFDKAQTFTKPYDYWVLPVNLKPNTSYTLSAILKGTKLTNIIFAIAPSGDRYSDFSSTMKIVILYGTGDISNKTITTDSNWTSPKLVVFANSQAILNSIFDNYDIQLEQNSTATEYEPYQEQIVYLDLKGNFIGKINDDIRDYLVTDKKKYWLVKNVGKVVLNGSENWTTNNSWNYTNTGIYILNQNPKTTEQVYSDRFFFYRSAHVNDVNGEVGIVWGNTLAFRISNTLVSDTNDFKTWLSTHNTTVLYQLAEPKIINLGTLPEPIKTFEGVNNIQLLANLDTEIEVVYAQDVKKYIDSKLAEISAQII